MYKNGISKNYKFSEFITKKWIEVYDQSEGTYNPNKEIRIKTSMLRSDLCGFICYFIYFIYDAYIAVKGNITVVKKILTANDFEAPNNTAANAMLLILQIIMPLAKRVGF